MRKFLGGYAAMALLGGALSVFAVSQENFFLAWFCYVPLFIAINKISPKQAFKAGLLFGCMVAAIGFYWMIPGAERFTGSSIMYGIIVFIISACFFCLYFGSLTFLFSKIKAADTRKASLLLNSLLMASLFCVGEALLMQIARGFPWFDYHSGYALVANLYSIQPAEFSGIHVMTFVVIAVNYLIAVFVGQKQWMKLLIPAGVVAIYMLTGYLIFQNFKNNLKPGKPVNIAILSENIAPEIKWNDSTGNQLAHRLIDMAGTAVSLKPDIALWSESAIPWTYKKDDDLVNAIIKVTKPANVTHILGINTQAGANTVYNSAYCLLPDGTVTGRYDKQVLLALIEKPLGSAILPFLSSNGFIAKTGANSLPLVTPYGKAGIIICNESAVPATAYTAANNGAAFLCNLSNDGWFNNTYIVGLHFYNARLRAVETRKDMAINSNDGYSGLVKASGVIAMQERSDEPLVKLVTVDTNHYNSLVAGQPLLFVYLCGLVLVVIVGLRLGRVV
jgi:apolipoprotein N-acyltransferase